MQVIYKQATNQHNRAVNHLRFRAEQLLECVREATNAYNVLGKLQAVKTDDVQKQQLSTMAKQVATRAEQMIHYAIRGMALHLRNNNRSAYRDLVESAYASYIAMVVTPTNPPFTTHEQYDAITQKINSITRASDTVKLGVGEAEKLGVTLQ